LLLHDIHARTVAAMPTILHELKARGFHVVHVVPATPDLPKTTTEPQLWATHKAPKALWPQMADPDVPALPASTVVAVHLPAAMGFGGDELPGTVSRPPAETGWPRGEEADLALRIGELPEVDWQAAETADSPGYLLAAQEHLPHFAAKPAPV